MGLLSAMIFLVGVCFTNNLVVYLQVGVVSCVVCRKAFSWQGCDCWDLGVSLFFIFGCGAVQYLMLCDL